MTQPTPLPEKNRMPPWRWAWIGFALSAVLWFGSTAYFQRIQQIDDIEYQSAAYEESEGVAKTQSNMRYLMLCQIGAGILALASLTYLVSQVDMHRPRPNNI